MERQPAGDDLELTPERKFYLPVVLIVLTGVAISVLACVGLRKWEERELEVEFARGSRYRALAIQSAVESKLVILEAMRALYVESDGLVRGGFNHFSKPLLSHMKGIRDLEWIPRVLAEDREQFERLMRARGLSQFEIRERNADGLMVPAQARDEYFPVSGTAPGESGQPSTGFDLGSEPVRLEAINRARDTGETAATERIRLVQETEDQFGFLVLVPAYRKGAGIDSVEDRRRNLDGFLCGVSRVSTLVEEEIQHLQPLGLDLKVSDMSAPEGQRTLYYHPSRTRMPGSFDEAGEQQRVFRTVSTFEVGGRQWTVSAAPAPGFLSEHLTNQPYFALGLGLAITALLVGYSLSRLKRVRTTALVNAQLQHEIAERKQIAEELTASERKHRLVAETASDLIVTIRGDGNVIYANPVLERTFGWRPEELIGKSLAVLIPESRASLRQAARTQGHRGDESAIPWESSELTAIHKDGHRVPIEASFGTLKKSRSEVLFTAIIRDISSRKQVQLERDRLAAVLEATPDFVGMADASLQPVYLNRSLREAAGVGQTDNIGSVPLDEFHPAWVRGILLEEAIPTALEEGSWSGETSLLTKDGEVPVSQLVLAHKNKNGETEFLSTIMRDISELQQSDQERHALQAQLRQAQKLETIGTLAGGIAHDFNNILTPILGYTQLVIDDKKVDASSRDLLKEVTRAASRARDLVKQLLTFSRQIEQERMPVQLGPLITETASLLRASLPSTIEVRLRIEIPEVTVMADPTQMHQVVLNLCTNAYQAMRGKSGIVEVGLSEADSAFVETQQDLESGRLVRLTVRDTGHGMAPETMERIFEPFYTTKGTGEGTGLGLSVVHGIVTGHAGKITVESHVGQGTLFSVYLPTTDLPVQGATLIEEAIETTRGRVLFVDDERMIVRMGAQMLQRLGYKVTATQDSQEARSTFISDPDAFDLVITDTTMPALTGTELAKELKEARSNIPILLTTGFSETVTSERLAECGIRALLKKPFTLNDLKKGIRRAIEESAHLSS